MFSGVGSVLGDRWRSVGGASRSSTSVTVGSTAVARNGADLEGFGEGGGPGASTFHEPPVVVAGGDLGVAELDGAEETDVVETADGTLSPNGRAASPRSLVARGAHRAAKGGGLSAAGGAGLQGLGGHARDRLT